MSQTDLRAELSKLTGQVDERPSALRGAMTKAGVPDKPQVEADFAGITREVVRHPLVLEELCKASQLQQKLFLSALAYLTALDEEALGDKLYYVCRLTEGCKYPVTAEDLRQMGLAYVPQDVYGLGKILGDLGRRFMVEALVVANMAGAAPPAVREVLVSLAYSCGIHTDQVRELGRAARAIQRTGIYFTTIEQAMACDLRAQYKVGDTFTFGNYPQGTNGEVQPIEWQVLRRDDDGLLVISKYALDCKQYNESFCSITWSQCTLRKWLNSEFIDKAFDATERQQIMQVHLRNPNSKFDSSVPDGPDTEDKIFLLSHDEAEQLFADDDSRQCRATAYAEENGACTEDNGMCYWWLRSPGSDAYGAALVNSDGGVGYIGVNLGGYAVRPAFKIAL